MMGQLLQQIHYSIEHVEKNTLIYSKIWRIILEI